MYCLSGPTTGFWRQFTWKRLRTTDRNIRILRNSFEDIFLDWANMLNAAVLVLTWGPAAGRWSWTYCGPPSTSRPAARTLGWVPAHQPGTHPRDWISTSDIQMKPLHTQTEGGENSLASAQQLRCFHHFITFILLFVLSGLQKLIYNEAPGKGKT